MNAIQRKGEILAACFLRQTLGKDIAKSILAINKVPLPGKLQKVSATFALTMSQMDFINLIIQFPDVAPSSTFYR